MQPVLFWHFVQRIVVRSGDSTATDMTNMSNCIIISLGRGPHLQLAILKHLYAGGYQLSRALGAARGPVCDVRRDARARKSHHEFHNGGGHCTWCFYFGSLPPIQTESACLKGSDVPIVHSSFQFQSVAMWVAVERLNESGGLGQQIRHHCHVGAPLDSHLDLLRKVGGSQPTVFRT